MHCHRIDEQTVVGVKSKNSCIIHHLKETVFLIRVPNVLGTINIASTEMNRFKSSHSIAEVHFGSKLLAQM